MAIYVRFRSLALGVLLAGSINLAACGGETSTQPPAPTSTAVATATTAIATASGPSEDPTSTSSSTPAPKPTIRPDKLDEAVVAWLRERAIPFDTSEPVDNYSDLMPLKQIIGDARIVALGEATHGTHEFFTMKHRILRFLVEQMGFSVFGIEDQWARQKPSTTPCNQAVVQPS